MSTEALHLQLLLAGLRASFERRAWFVVLELGGASSGVIAGRPYLRVAPSGRITDHTGADRGNVHDL